MRLQRLSNQMKRREKQLRAAELCLTGKSCRAVAKAMDCSLSTAHGYITRGMELMLPRESAMAAYITARERINEVYCVNHAKMLEGDEAATRHCQKSIDQWLKLHRLEGDNAITNNIAHFNLRDPNRPNAEISGILVDFVKPSIEYNANGNEIGALPSPADYEQSAANHRVHREATAQRANDEAYARAAGRPVVNGAVAAGSKHWRFKP